MVLTPVRENQIFFLTFLVATIIHLSLIAPLSQWLDRSLLPRLADQNLEIDLYEIQSNIAQVKKKRTSPPEPLLKENKDPQRVPRQVEEPQKPAELAAAIKTWELRPVPKRKVPLSTQVEKDLKADTRLNTASSPPIVAAEQTTPPAKTDNDVLLPLKEIVSTQQGVQEKGIAPENLSNQEIIRSPLFIEKKQEKKREKNKIEGPPAEIRGTFRGEKPEETNSENLQYSMNSYQWTFERFIDNWVVDIQKWWKAPLDYINGEIPDGGDLWVQVHLSLSGKLLSYKVMQSNVTSEMELMAIQALIGSLKRPELPSTFYEDRLIINWRFIYPSLRPPLKMRR